MLRLTCSRPLYLVTFSTVYNLHIEFCRAHSQPTAALPTLGRVVYCMAAYRRKTDLTPSRCECVPMTQNRHSGSGWTATAKRTKRTKLPLIECRLSKNPSYTTSDSERAQGSWPLLVTFRLGQAQSTAMSASKLSCEATGQFKICLLTHDVLAGLTHLKRVLEVHVFLT